jgi:hypothetical protein
MEGLGLMKQQAPDHGKPCSLVKFGWFLRTTADVRVKTLQLSHWSELYIRRDT